MGSVWALLGNVTSWCRKCSSGGAHRNAGLLISALFTRSILCLRSSHANILALCNVASSTCNLATARVRLSSTISGERCGGIAMPDLGPHPPARRVARRNAIGRRFFLESCLGAMTGAIAAQSSPALAQTVAASSVNFFPGFRRQTVQTSGTTINVLVGGDGPPVLLLHGYPQTHVEWRKIAPELAKNHALVIPD